MRKYEKPNGVAVEMSFEEHIAASGEDITEGSCTTVYQRVEIGCQEQVGSVTGYAEQPI